MMQGQEWPHASPAELLAELRCVELALAGQALLAPDDAKELFPGPLSTITCVLVNMLPSSARLSVLGPMAPLHHEDWSHSPTVSPRISARPAADRGSLAAE
jgi:hypothetical protein